MGNFLFSISSSLIALTSVMIYINSSSVHSENTRILASADVHGVAFAYLTRQCASCHDNGHDSGGFGFILNVERMINAGFIVPGRADQSPIYRAMKHTLGLSLPMPPIGPQKNDLELIARWINNLE